MHEKVYGLCFFKCSNKDFLFSSGRSLVCRRVSRFLLLFRISFRGCSGKTHVLSNLSILFNLAIALTFALSFNLFFGIGYNLTHGKIRYGLLTAGSGMLLGNLQGLIEFVSMYVLKEQVSRGYYWSSSRVIPFTINEFPYFTFIHGDLHSHLLAIPFQLLVLVFLLNIYFRKSEHQSLKIAWHLLHFQYLWDFYFRPTPGISRCTSA